MTHPTARWFRDVPPGCSAADLIAKYDLVAAACATVPGAHAPASLSERAEGDEGDVVAFERLEIGEPFGRAVMTAITAGRTDDAVQLACLAARVLAAIHATPLPATGVELAALVSNPLPASAGGPVLLHGDFGFSNLFVLAGERPIGLQVIDPLPPPMMPQAALVVGPAEWDVAVMVSCLAGRPPMPFLRNARARRDVIRVFCADYRRASGRDLEQLGPWVEFSFTTYAASRARGARMVRWAAARLLARRTDHALT